MNKMFMCVYKNVYCSIYMCTDELVECPPLTNPINGMMTCSLKDVGTPSYGDTCSFTCKIGHELNGTSTRTCQSNGSWSGSEAICKRGK